MSDYDALIAENPVASNEEQALTNLYGTRELPGGDIAEAKKQLGLPGNVVTLNPKGFAEDAKAKKLNDLVQGNPPMADWLAADTSHAPVARDDLENLDRFSHAGLLDGLEIAARRAYFHSQNNKRAARDLALGGQNYETFDEFEKRADSESVAEPGWFANTFGGFVGAMASTAPSMVAGAGIGALAGPGGAALGAALGAGTDMALSTIGQIKRSLHGVRDHDGKTISEPAQWAAALTGGAAAYALGSFGAGSAGSTLIGERAADLATRFALLSVKNPGIGRAVGRVAWELGKGGLELGAVNTGLYLASELPQQAAKLGLDIETALNDDKEFDRLVAGALESMASGFVLGAGLHAIPVGKNALLDRARAEQQKVELTEIDQRVAAAQEVQTRNVDPDAFKTLIEDHLGLEPIKIGIDAVDAARVQGKLEFLDEDTLRAARESGADVEIPAGDYYSKVEPDVHEMLRPEIRTESGLTALEAEAVPPVEVAEVEIPQGLGGEVRMEEFGPVRLPEILQDLSEAQSEWRDSLWLGPLFEQPQAAGLTKTDFTRMSKLVQEQQRALAKAVYDAAEREAMKRDKPIWKEYLRRAKEEVEKKLELRPDIRADKLLHGEFGFLETAPKLDKFAVDAIVPGASERLPKKYFEKNGLTPDEMISLTGHATPKELIDALLNLREQRGAKSRDKYFRDLVQSEAERLVEERHGKLDEVAMREALNAALEVKQLEVMIEEIKELGGDQALTVDDVRAKVRDLHGRMSVRNGKDVFGLVRLVQKYGNQAFTLKDTDPAGALQARQRQMLNLGLLQEARRFEREVKRTTKLAERFSSRRVVSGMPQEFTDRIHQVLNSVSVSIPRSMENLAEALRGETLEQWAQARDVHIGPSVGAVRMDKATVGQFRDIADTLKSLTEVGRAEGKIQAGARKLEIEQVKADLKTAFSKFKPPSDLKISAIGRGIDSALLKPETWLSWVDGGDINGLIHRTVIRPLMRANYKYEDLEAGLAKRFADMPKHSFKLSTLLDNQTILDPDNGKPYKFTHESMISMLLNMGSDQNKYNLLHGNQITEGQLLNFLERNVTQEHADFVNHVWETVDSLWPELAATVKEATGIAPERVRARPFKINGVKFNGGYYPLIRDTVKSPRKGLEPMQDKTFNEWLTAPNAFKNRTGAVYPLDLSLDKLGYLLTDTARGIAFHIPIREASKVFDTQEFRQGVINSFGKEFYDKIRPWLADIRWDGGARQLDGMQAWQRGLATLRGNVAQFLTGFRLGTAVIHGGSALSNSIAEIGEGNPIKGAKDFARASKMLFETDEATSQKWRDFVYENSGEIRNRTATFERDLRQSLGHVIGESKLKARYRAWSGFMIRQLDQASAVPTWLAVYRNALEKHDHETAVDFADRAVRRAHGSGSTISLAPISRQGEFSKLFTMFYQFFNHNYNQDRDIGHELAAKPEMTKGFMLFSKLMLYTLVPALIHEAVRGEKTEDESWGKFMARATATQLFSGVPLLRDVWHGMLWGKAPQATPLAEIPAQAIRLHNDWFNEEEDDPEFVKHTLDLIGSTTGYGSKVTSAWAQQFYDWAANNPRAEEVDWIRLIAEGQRKPKGEK